MEVPPLLTDLTPLLYKEIDIFDWIVDLDNFFGCLYTYYTNKGFYPSILKKCIILVQYIILIVVLFFLCYRIDYSTSLETKQLALHDMKFTFISVSLLICSIVGGMIYIIQSYHFIRSMYKIKHFYLHLKLTDEKIQNIHWITVVDIISEAQKRYKFYKLYPTLSNYQITHHIMKMDNILIALVKNDLFPTHITIPYLRWIWPYLPKLYVICIQHCIIYSLFDDHKRLRSKFDAIQIMSQKLTIYSLGILFLSPLIILLGGMYFIFRYFEDFRQNKQSLIRFRRWSRYSMWLFRQHNELEHIFHKRLSIAYIYSELYIQNFNNEILLILARFVAFICGSVLVTLLGLSLIDEDFLYIHLHKDKTVFWFIGICGILLSTCRVLIKDEYQLFIPDHYMKKIVQYTKYFPDIWKNNFHAQWVKNDFTLLFQHRITYILEELASIIIVPYLLYYKVSLELPTITDWLYNHIQKDIQFNLGYVCKPNYLEEQEDLEKSMDQETINMSVINP